MPKKSSYRREYIEQAKKLVRLFARDRDIAEFFGITDRLLRMWKVQHPEFAEALRATKEEVDQQVERALAQRALGYSHESEKVFQFQGQIVRTTTIEHYPPDTHACMNWLFNRQPDKWRPSRAGNGVDDDTPTPTKVEVTVLDGRKVKRDA